MTAIPLTAHPDEYELTRPAPPVLRFWAYLVPQVLVAPVLAFAVTFFHELAHVAAALAVGGEVTEFSWLPSASNLGHMRWVPPAGAGDLDYVLVSVAPYLMWAAAAGTALVVAWLPNRLHWSLASTLFVWLYAVPIGDIAVLIAWGLGWWVQRRLFRDCPIGPVAYAVTTVVVGGARATAAAVGLALSVT